MSLIYIASSLDNGERVKQINDILSKQGHTITYDWTKHGRVTDTDQLVEIAKGEYEGVKDCDVFLMVHPARLGSHFEFGAAYSLNKKIFILEETEISELKSFYFLPGIEIYKTLDEILAVLNTTYYFPAKQLQINSSQNKEI